MAAPFLRKDKQANTTGAHNAALGLAGSFLSEKTSKQDAVARSQAAPFLSEKTSKQLFKDLGPSFFELGPRTLVKGQKSRGF
jgi:hypothetical protein